MRKLCLVFTVAIGGLLGTGCSSGGVCTSATGCAAGMVCIKGGTCARSCFSDGGSSPCPAGQTCQTTSGYCTGTGCEAISVQVCL